eukprot:SAG31_NODE_2611_length_5382_cov_3.775128_1_plen_37_part_10
MSAPPRRGARSGALKHVGGPHAAAAPGGPPGRRRHPC